LINEKPLKGPKVQKSGKVPKKSGSDLKKCKKSEKRNGIRRSSSDQVLNTPAINRGKTAATYLGA
jgi:hypothetical protein